MTKEQVLKFIESIDNDADGREIERAASARRAAIAQDAWKRKIAEYWKRAVFFREGETLYCAAAGTFIGGPMQRGDKGTVYRMDIDGRKKTIWLKIGKRIIGFSNAEPLRYQLQREKPATPISKEMRDMGDRLAKVLP